MLIFHVDNYWRMMMDHLFLLDPQVHEVDGYRRFCIECAQVTGYLTYYPEIFEKISIQTVSPVRPRKEIIDILGEDNQLAPVLILDEASQLPESIEVKRYNGIRFIDDEEQILWYLGLTYGGGLPL
jgi:hypothetical protein